MATNMKTTIVAMAIVAVFAAGTMAMVVRAENDGGSFKVASDGNVDSTAEESSYAGESHVAAKENPNLTTKAILRKKLLPVQTFKSSSGRLLSAKCKIPCSLANDTCPPGCECDIDQNAEYERYYCEPYESGICSPCSFDDGNDCRPGCGCYQIEGTSEYGCLPN